jgi:hypothetical protein
MLRYLGATTGATTLARFRPFLDPVDTGNLLISSRSNAVFGLCHAEGRGFEAHSRIDVPSRRMFATVISHCVTHSWAGAANVSISNLVLVAEHGHDTDRLLVASGQSLPCLDLGASLRVPVGSQGSRVSGPRSGGRRPDLDGPAARATLPPRRGRGAPSRDRDIQMAESALGPCRRFRPLPTRPKHTSAGPIPGRRNPSHRPRAGPFYRGVSQNTQTGSSTNSPADGRPEGRRRVADSAPTGRCDDQRGEATDQPDARAALAMRSSYVTICLTDGPSSRALAR